MQHGEPTKSPGVTSCRAKLAYLCLKYGWSHKSFACGILSQVFGDSELLSDSHLSSHFMTCLGGVLAIAVACSTEDGGVEQADEQAGGGNDGGEASATVAVGGAGGERVTAEGGAPGEPTSGGAGAGAAAGGFGSIACADETRAVAYQAGLELVSEELGLRLTLLESRPGPRVGNLRWTLQVLDAEGTPVTGATVKVSPFMPDHHHGSPLIPTIKESGEGVYVAAPINLTMPGFWRTTVRVTTDAWTDIVIIPLCIE